MKSPHGTVARYEQRCRCAECKAANLAWQREQYGRVPLEEYRALVKPEHGTVSRYRKGCRCGPCSREIARLVKS